MSVYEGVNKTMFFNLEVEELECKVALIKEQCRLNIRVFSLSQRTINDRIIDLPTEQILNTGRVDIYIKQNSHTYHWVDEKWWA